jgi:hypothetical protein
VADVFLHVGLPKTGTTTIQAALETHAEALAEAGVLFPGGRHRAQRLAVYDLLGQRVSGEDDRVAGSLSRLLAEVSAHTGRSAIVSEEELGLARPRHARRLVRGLAPHRVFVVIGVRDLARTLVSAWQQSVVNGGTTSWQDFIDSARSEGRASKAGSGIAFWLRHDVLRVIDTWATAVPVERIRVVTVPARDESGQTLLARFADATGLPADTWDARAVGLRNVGLGAAELEVVRRLNQRVTGHLNQAQHRFVIEAGIRARLEVERPRPLRLPAEHLPWTRQYGERLCDELRRRDVEVFGDLCDLVPADRPAGSRSPDALSEAELLAASESALTSLALSHGVLFRRYRRAFVERTGQWPAVGEVVASVTRAGGFLTQKAALRRADENRVFAWAARAYLDRTARSAVGGAEALPFARRGVSGR